MYHTTVFNSLQFHDNFTQDLLNQFDEKLQAIKTNKSRTIGQPIPETGHTKSKQQHCASSPSIKSLVSLDDAATAADSDFSSTGWIKEHDNPSTSAAALTAAVAAVRAQSPLNKLPTPSSNIILHGSSNQKPSKKRSLPHINLLLKKKTTGPKAHHNATEELKELKHLLEQRKKSSPGIVFRSSSPVVLKKEKKGFWLKTVFT